MVERHLAKVNVAGSNPVYCSSSVRHTDPFPPFPYWETTSGPGGLSFPIRITALHPPLERTIEVRILDRELC